jgi:hypothetical protein
MGWKKIKSHFGIEHIVQVDGDAIKIGSGYVPDLLTIKLAPTIQVEKSSIISRGGELDIIADKMLADLSKVKELFESPDTFGADIPVFTFEGGEIQEKKCEEFGWPNVTHDGCLMYENSFSKDRSEVVVWAQESAKSHVENAQENLQYCEKKLADAKEYLAKKKEILDKATTLT